MRARPQDMVAAGYDAIHQRYATWQSKIVGDPRDRYVQTLLSLLPEHFDVLEIGCGAAVEPTRTLARRGRLVGVDISWAQIERARAALPDAAFIHGDITVVGFEANSFDVVVALYTFTHIPSAQLPPLLRRMAGWLRPRGLLLATFGSGGRHDSFVDDWLGVPMFFAGYDEVTNALLVEEAGLTVVESQVEPMWEPESEPGRGPEEVKFHWILARKDLRASVRTGSPVPVPGRSAALRPARHLRSRPARPV